MSIRAFLAGVTLCALMVPSLSLAEKRPLIYEPVPTSTTRSYFADGQPFAIATADRAIVMLVVSPEKIAGYKYVRVWCLYYNAGSEPVLFDPAKAASLISTKIKKGEAQELQPEAPSTILKQISNELANKEMAQTIGGALASFGQSMSVQMAEPTTIKSNTGETWTVNDRTERVRAANDRIGERTRAGLEKTRTAYDLYSTSVSAGILRRNTVFPGSSVNGFIYFPATKRYNGNWPDYSHVVQLQLPHDEIKVAFNPAAGE
jgi:hypothetical protein